MFAHGITITVVRPAGFNRWGEPLPGTETAVGGCWADSSDDTGTETHDHSDTDVARLTLYCPPGTDIRRTDQVRIDGELWGVDHRPTTPVNPFTGWQPNTVVSLVRGEG